MGAGMAAGRLAVLVLLAGCVPVPWFVGEHQEGIMQMHYAGPTQHFGCDENSFTTPVARALAAELIYQPDIFLRPQIWLSFNVPCDNGLNPDGSCKQQIANAPCEGCFPMGKMYLQMIVGGYYVNAYATPYENPWTNSYLETYFVEFGLTDFWTWRWYANIHVGNNEWIQIRREWFPTRSFHINVHKPEVCFVHAPIDIACSPYATPETCLPPS